MSETQQPETKTFVAFQAEVWHRPYYVTATSLAEAKRLFDEYDWDDSGPVTSGEPEYTETTDDNIEWEDENGHRLYDEEDEA